MMLTSAVEHIVEHWWIFPVSFAGLFVLARMKIRVPEFKFEVQQKDLD